MFRHIFHCKPRKPIGSKKEEGGKDYGEQRISLKGKRQHHPNDTKIGEIENTFIQFRFFCRCKKVFIDQGRQSQIDPAQQCGVGMCVEQEFIIKGKWRNHIESQQYPHQCHKQKIEDREVDMFS